jgi:chemotaxis protein MotB
MSAKHNAPVIIKRKKVIAGGGHHGGAWKVAYADFVTAMMAFFMLMWLLNATTEKQRKGIADYFNPTIPINRISGGGDGAFGGDSVFSQEALARNGYGASQRNPTAEAKARGDSGVTPGQGEGAGAAERQAFTEIEKALSATGGESMASTQALRHIVTRVTDEGLIVEIFDLEGEPLFVPGSDTPEPIMIELAGAMARIFGMVGNQVAVNGHVRSEPVVLADNPVWRLSQDRAARTRDLLFADGLVPARVQRVSGFADRKLAVVNAGAPRNNRIELILLRPGIS